MLKLVEISSFLRFISGHLCEIFPSEIQYNILNHTACGWCSNPVFASCMDTLIDDSTASDKFSGLKTFIFEFFGFVLTLDMIIMKKISQKVGKAKNILKMSTYRSENPGYLQVFQKSDL